MQRDRRTTTIFQQSSSADIVKDEIDYEQPEDAVIQIKPKAMKRLRELRAKEKKDTLILRMGAL